MMIMNWLRRIFVPLMLLLFVSCNNDNDTENAKDVYCYELLRNTSWVNVDDLDFVEKITFETNKADIAYWLPRGYMNGYYLCSAIQYIIENGVVYIAGYNSEMMLTVTLKSFSVKEIDDYKMVIYDGVSEIEYYKVFNNIKMDVATNNVLDLSKIVGRDQILKCEVSDASVLEVSKDTSYRIVAKAHGKSFVCVETTAGVKVLEIDVTGSLMEQCDYYYKALWLHSLKMEQYFGTPSNVNEDYVYKHGDNIVMLITDSYGFVEGLLLYYDCDSAEMKAYLDSEYDYYSEYDLYAGNNMFVVYHEPAEKMVFYYPIDDEESRSGVSRERNSLSQIPMHSLLKALDRRP